MHASPLSSPGARSTRDIIFSNIAPGNDTGTELRKIVVFDMDETLGIFSDLGEFMHILDTIIAKRVRRVATHSSSVINVYDYFNELLDIYPELLRPRILDIMRFLARMKRAGKCSNVMIYTNNSGPFSWSHHIKDYFNKKAGYIGPQWPGGLFDKVIGAFKRPNGERVEIGRTTHDKTYNDFVRCTNMAGRIEVFFIDDREHPGMHAENVYVINVKPYTRELSMRDFIRRFKRSTLFHTLQFTNSEIDDYYYMPDGAKKPSATYSESEHEVDKMVGATILEKLHDFFDISIKPPLRGGKPAASARKRFDRRGGGSATRRAVRI